MIFSYIYFVMIKSKAFFWAYFAIDTAFSAALFIEITAKAIGLLIPFSAIFIISNTYTYGVKTSLTSFFVHST